MIGQCFIRNLNNHHRSTKWMETRVLQNKIEWCVRGFIDLSPNGCGCLECALASRIDRNLNFYTLIDFEIGVASSRPVSRCNWNSALFSPLTMSEIVWSSILWCLADRSFNCLLAFLNDAYAISFQRFLLLCFVAMRLKKREKDTSQHCD